MGLPFHSILILEPQRTFDAHSFQWHGIDQVSVVKHINKDRSLDVTVLINLPNRPVPLSFPVRDLVKRDGTYRDLPSS
jgi:hypothetical protein